MPQIEIIFQYILVCELVRSLPQNIHKQLLSDVLFTVGVFKCQVELVFFVQKTEAFVGVGPRASLRTTSSIDVDIYIFSQLTSII